MILNSNTLASDAAAGVLMASAPHLAKDTLEMDVTFVGGRQMEVRDAVKLSSRPTARQLRGEAPIELRTAFQAPTICAHHDTR